MRYYTTYFAALRRLPVSEITPVSIARTQPKGVYLSSIECLKPDGDLLADWKLHEIDWLRYTIQYNKQLRQIDVHEFVMDLHNTFGDDHDIAFVCWESPEKKCHRHLVAKWLRKAGYSVEEYKGE